ncbi:T9SS type A sorting domain-containing protein [Cryomorpha ignava]|uniref:T9SS type A sorting domain-containing protein n=1 Tax=Cryomorpha ignava TaxID=101383 RepID=A0A7K3WNZ6_9FLAO|nr:FG-GAP-like repeat-containing protein [Cryomorpha ignava]NEN23224.1 T9SS type A sorting domain-containing protein [Cryomorpha ignava]
MKIALLLSALTLSIAVSAQNSCDSALVVVPGIYTVVDTLDGAPPENSCFGFSSEVTHAEWYTYTASEDIILVISSDFSQNLGVDTRLNVFTGTCDDLNCLAYNDDGGSSTLTYLQVFLPEDMTVYIAWDNRYSHYGFDFEISEMEYVPPLLGFTPVNLSGDGTKLGVVDMNGDHLDDVVGVSFQDRDIQISYQQPDGSLDFQILPTVTPTYLPSWSMAAGDLDGNGYNDLIFGGGQGVSFMFANENGTAYTHFTDNNYIFSQRSNCVDINNDGYLDAFICHDVDPNVYYINNENDSLTFNQGGLGDVETGGNYGSLWVDYDMDGDIDLFISKCRGGNSPARINELHRNNGDGTYTEIAETLSLNDSIQTWSSAWGDYDNDGDFDILIGASSFADGTHKLLRNDGGTFTDITAGSGIDNVTGTSIENICHDFDNDGFVDVLGMGNSFMHNNGDMTFTQIEFDPGNGPVGDLNNDGFLDIVNGGTLYINQGNDNNYIKVVPQGTESNLSGVGAIITVYTPSGNFMRQIFSGDGFKYMSSLTAHFGLGQEQIIDSVVVAWPSGNVDVHVNPDINTTLLAVEGMETSPVGLNENAAEPFLIFPNPARNYIIVESPNTYNLLTYTIFDLNGKRVQQGTMSGKSINISSLSSGAYLLQLIADGQRVEQKIIKE